MKPFEHAWVLLKMPLVRDSIEYGEPDSTGFPTATATFQDRDDPNVQYPMEAYGDQGGTKVRVLEPLGTLGYLRGGEAGHAYFRTGYDPYPRNTDTADISTEPHHRRKGIGTAMYDLINEMSKTKGTRLETYPSRLSDSSGPLWAKVTGLPYNTPDEKSKFHQGEYQSRLEWPKEGSYT